MKNQRLQMGRRLDQSGLPCARVEEVSLDERLNAARQARHKIDKNALIRSPAIPRDFASISLPSQW